MNAEEAIDEHIAAAAARAEPMELVPHSFLPPFARVTVESREDKVSVRAWDMLRSVELTAAVGAVLSYPC